MTNPPNQTEQTMEPGMISNLEVVCVVIFVAFHVKVNTKSPFGAYFLDFFQATHKQI